MNLRDTFNILNASGNYTHHLLNKYETPHFTHKACPHISYDSRKAYVHVLYLQTELTFVPDNEPCLLRGSNWTLTYYFGNRHP